MTPYSFPVKERGGNALVIIDPQYDFHKGGSLAVPGADESAKAMAKFIKDHITELSSIIVSLDFHSMLHIGNPAYWTYEGTPHDDMHL